MKIIAALSLALISVKAFAGSVGGNGGSLEVTQIANHLELVKQVYELEYQSNKIRDQLQRQTDMVNDMKVQGRSISDPEWGRASSDLQDLSNIVRQGESLAYSASNTDATYRQKFQGYDYYSREKNTTPSTFSDRYADWSKVNSDSISSSMKAANLQSAQFQTEYQTMRSIQNLSRSSKGRLEAIQVGNMIAAQQVGQMQKLRSLMMAQMQMQAAFMSTQTSEKDQGKARSEQFLGEDISHVRIDDGQHF